MWLHRLNSAAARSFSAGRIRNMPATVFGACCQLKLAFRPERWLQAAGPYRHLANAPFSAGAAAVLLGCLFATGCASNREGKSFGQAASRVTVLSDSIEPLRQQFNADKDKLRVLALLSPT